MDDSNPPKLQRRFRLRMRLVFALLVLSGCRPGLAKPRASATAFSFGTWKRPGRHGNSSSFV